MSLGTKIKTAGISKTEWEKLKSSAFFLITWGIIFIVFHIMHMRFFVVDVIFYETLKDLIFSGIITVSLYVFIFKKWSPLSASNFILTLFVGLSCGYIFAITVPTIIDRSLSAYILEKFVQRGGGLKQDALLDMFVEEFIPESKLMDIRLQEALSSGTLTLEGDCIIITQKGRRVAKFTRFYRNNLLPKKRLLLDRVTDELTDPFRNSAQAVDYTCEPAENVEG